MTHIYVLYLLFSNPQYDDIVTSVRKDDPNVYEKDDELKYDDIKSPSTTKQPPPPCPTPYSSHITTSKEETPVIKVNKVISYTDLDWDDSGNKLMFIPSSSSLPPASSDPLACSNTKDTPPLSTIEPVIYSAVVRKNDTKMTVKISTFVDNIDTS